ncbi:HK97 family phage prohead protease [Carnobacterium maltaromaticum]|uniref:HK97 family phage prohead protease n=1 Tax=Carnobacterium maltaromaticum TaxID=2751 RepID=UPI00165BE3EB|nr:HK97 family phage prohead protease [Carnobacterium maltaromaticum]MBC9787181.1 HK97 family phage prohead protease [Carnobacterium maltaromaticum]
MKIMTGAKEIRQVTTQIELRNDGESNEIIEGYALKFDKWSDDLGWFREKLASESLEKTDMSNVTALFNHNESQILGRSGINLELDVDNIGLRFKVKPTDTSYSRDLMENIRQGVINQCSFAFTVSREQDSEEWRENLESGIYERTIKNIDKLYDVSVVTTPAYPDTEAVVGARSKELVDKLELRKQNKEIELLMLEAEAYA